MVGEPGVGQVAARLRVHPLAPPAGLARPREPARSPTARRRAYLPVIDLLKGYFEIEDRDDAREIREKVTGKLLTLDQALEPTLPACWPCLTCLWTCPSEDSRRVPLAGAAPPSAASGRSTASSGCCCGRARCSRCWSSSRTCTGSTPRPRRCSTAWSRACRPPACCCWSTTGPSTSTAGASKTYYRQLRIDPLPPESAEELLDALLGDDPALAPLKQLLIKRRQPVLPRGERPDPRGDEGAGRGARAVSADATGPARSRSRPRCRRSWPRASTGSRSGDKRLLQAAAVIGKDVPFALLQAIAELPEERCAAARPICRPPSSSTRRGSSPISSTPSSTRSPTRSPTAACCRSAAATLHARIVEAIESAVTRIASASTSSGSPITPSAASCGRRPSEYLRQAGQQGGARSALRTPGPGSSRRSASSRPCRRPGHTGAERRHPPRVAAVLTNSVKFAGGRSACARPRPSRSGLKTIAAEAGSPRVDARSTGSSASWTRRSLAAPARWRSRGALVT